MHIQREIQWHTLALFVFILVGVGGGAHIASATSVPANLIRMQFNDDGCSNGTGPIVGNPAGDGVWTAWFGDADTYDADCVRIGITSADIPTETDIRFCAQASDEGGLNGWEAGSGTPICGPWASAGGGWSTWITDNDAYDPDAWRFRIDTQATQAMSGKYISNIRLGLQVIDDTNIFSFDGCTNSASANIYTPYQSAGGGWTSWVTDGSASNFNCLRVDLDTTLLPMPPVTTLKISVNGGAYSAPAGNAITIDFNDTVALSWNGTNTPTSCIKTAGAADFVVSNTTGPDSIAGPVPGTPILYKVRCDNSGGAGTQDQITITRNGTPVTTMTYALNGSATYTQVPNALTIDANDTLSFKWSGTYSPTSCTKTAGPIDFVVSNTTGPDTVTSPTAGGAAASYSVRCDNSGGTGTTDTVSVTRTAVPVTTMTISVNGGAYTSPSSVVNVNPLDTIAFKWSGTNTPTSCAKTAGSPADFAVSNTTGPDSVAPPSPGVTSTYGVTCSNSGGPGTTGTISVRTNASCGSYLSGSTNTYYNMNPVPYGETCSGNGTGGVPHHQDLVCNNGILTPSQGSYTFLSCSTDPTPPQPQQPLVFTANGFSTSTTVRAGSSVSLVWDGKNSTNCSVSGVGGFTSANVTLPSTLIVGASTVTINTKSVFTFTCTTPSSTTKQATINIVPNVQEI